MQAALVSSPVRHVRQAKNAQFANDGSLQSVERLVEKLTFKFYSRAAKLGIGMEEDDVRQEIRLAYTKASQKWRPDGGALFATYFQTVAQNEFNRRIERAVTDRTEMGMISYQDIMAGATDEQTGDPLEYLATDDMEASPEDHLVEAETVKERLSGLSFQALRLMTALIVSARPAGDNSPYWRQLGEQIGFDEEEYAEILKAVRAASCICEGGTPAKLRHMAQMLGMHRDEIRRVKVELMGKFGTAFV
jgi:DNA-directed RNA polymerase specialized sigma24 family protein